MFRASVWNWKLSSLSCESFAQLVNCVIVQQQLPFSEMQFSKNKLSSQQDSVTCRLSLSSALDSWVPFLDNLCTASTVDKLRAHGVEQGPQDRFPEAIARVGRRSFCFTCSGNGAIIANLTNCTQTVRASYNDLIYGRSLRADVLICRCAPRVLHTFRRAARGRPPPRGEVKALLSFGQSTVL